MLVTNDWLLRWQTPNGGYNKKQLTLLGVPWPPRRGWKYDVLDAEITDEAARAFELASGRQEKYPS
ncbi:hypothetical protein KYT87_21335 [Achromobacter sp. ES-001]|uniref:hypothetical protein n=1 Tax=Achromobacter sp. ES-001 TaxID=2860286 RepID=UPI001C63F07A|nr:hypothetical protein [Achromobacter sp. ES-001]QYJ20198.1 hypothetical protein KYT87_21335 [Achromobacter sp. ES-001]